MISIFSCDYNKYTMQYISRLGEVSAKACKQEKMPVDESSDVSGIEDNDVINYDLDL